MSQILIKGNKINLAYNGVLKFSIVETLIGLLKQSPGYVANSTMEVYNTPGFHEFSGVEYGVSQQTFEAGDAISYQSTGMAGNAINNSVFKKIPVVLGGNTNIIVGFNRTVNTGTGTVVFLMLIPEADFIWLENNNITGINYFDTLHEQAYDQDTAYDQLATYDRLRYLPRSVSYASSGVLTVSAQYRTGNHYLVFGIGTDYEVEEYLAFAVTAIPTSVDIV